MKLAGTPIVVLGMHRSGTSAITNALANLGLYLGRAEDLLEATEHNEEGFWERPDVVRLNDRALATLGMSYQKVGFIPALWRELPFSAGLLNEMEALLRMNFAAHPLWGWKDPRTTVLLPFYKEVLRRLGSKPHYVLCVRNPLSVSASLSKREKLSEHLALGLWLRYTLSALQETNGESRVLVLYESFLQDPIGALQPVVKLVENWTPNDQAWTDARNVVRQDLSHTKPSEEALDRHPSIIKRTFDLCKLAAAAPEAFAHGAFDSQIGVLWKELQDWDDLLKGADPAPGRLRLFWQKGGKVEHVDTEYVPSGGWQTLRATVSASAGSLVGAAFYHLPCLVWIRRAEWKSPGKASTASLRPGFSGHLEGDGSLRRLLVLPGPEELMPEQLLLQAPTEGGPYELEVEVFLEATFDIAVDCAKHLARQLRATTQKAAEMEMRLRRIDTGVGRGVLPGS